MKFHEMNGIKGAARVATSLFLEARRDTATGIKKRLYLLAVFDGSLKRGADGGSCCS